MRILILNHYASSPDQVGAETRHFEFSLILKEKYGHEVSIMVGNYHHLNDSEWFHLLRESFKEINVKGINFVVVKTRIYRGNSMRRFFNMIDYFKNGLKVARRLKRTGRKFDVVVASSPHPFSLILGEKIADIFSCKLILELRDIWPDDLIISGKLSPRSPLKYIFDYISRRTYPEADGIITLIPDISYHLDRLKISIPKNRLFFIPNGLNVKSVENIPPECEVLSKRLKSQMPEGYRIGYFGSFSPTNGILNFVEFLRKIDDKLPKEIKFVFFGRGPQRSEIIKLQTVISHRIKVFEPIPKKCVYGVIKETMDALLFMLSNFENLKYPAFSSYKILEYMVTGKPILSVYHEGFPHFGIDGNAFFVRNNPDSFISAIRSLANVKFVPGNVEYVKKYRDIEKLAEKFNEVIVENS